VMATTAAPAAAHPPVMDRENVAPAVKQVNEKQAKPAEKKRCVPRAMRRAMRTSRATETHPHRAFRTPPDSRTPPGPARP